MALTTAQKQHAARYLAHQVFAKKELSASMHLDHMYAVIDYLDTKMNALASTLTQNVTVLTNIANGMPEPFKTQSTVENKAEALGTWALATAGALP